MPGQVVGLVALDPSLLEPVAAQLALPWLELVLALVLDMASLPKLVLEALC